MLKSKIAMVLGLLLLAGAAPITAQSRPFSQQVKQLTVINRTGAEVKYLFVSPNDSQHWGPDILGASTTLPSGGSVGFFTHYPQACGKFDLMAIHANGNVFVQRGVEVCDNRNNQRVTMTAQNRQNNSANYTYAKLTFTNNLDVTIRFLFVSPADSQYWGADYMDQNTVLAPGASHSILVPVGGSSVTYNVLGVDDQEQQHKFDIDVDNSQQEYNFEFSGDGSYGG
ncbi:MAG: hypothetical protein K1X75_00640 [Leptospirales bacterium]|nr:hypothetical protein [Leptospirales bacterium]